MRFPELSVRREFSAEAINAVANHPEVRPWIGVPGAGEIDMTAALGDYRNVLLMTDGGGFFLHPHGSGIYEVHTQFVPEKRGSFVVSAARDAQRYMFCRTDCMEVVTKVPRGNVAATVLVRKMHMSPLFTTDEAAVYGLSIWNWAANAEIDVEVAQAVFSVPVASAKMLAIALEMTVFGMIDKALAFYARFSALSGTPPLQLLSVSPPIFAHADRTAVLHPETFEVLPCR